MKKTLFALLLILVTAPALRMQAQTIDSLWRPFTYLVGEWTATDNSGTATFAFDLEHHVLVRKNHAVARAENGQPTGVHEDLMTIYNEPGRGLRALYTDNESHVIHYTVRTTAAGDTIEFLGDKQPGAPRFRLLYLRTGERTVDVSFDIAMPNAPDAFRHYVTGSTTKK